MTVPETDVFFAEKHSLRFVMCVKKVRGAPWLNIVEDAPLTVAMEAAKSRLDVSFEVGVFRLLADSSGFLYWTSKRPTLYGSDILREAAL